VRSIHQNASAYDSTDAGTNSGTNTSTNPSTNASAHAGTDAGTNMGTAVVFTSLGHGMQQLGCNQTWRLYR
jgi:hypothetical protein